MFQVLATKSGKLDADKAPKNAAVTARVTASRPPKKREKADSAAEKKINDKPSDSTGNSETSKFGLSVRVEINLPSDATAETYDNIFKSIKKNLLNG